MERQHQAELGFSEEYARVELDDARAIWGGPPAE